ncbi:MAG: HAMP domain-containing histidine kinase [Myxococcales bacterium]|nr:HAMP domain-containing histidine kinase [Myxococcales bacterium]
MTKTRERRWSLYSLPVLVPLALTVVLGLVLGFVSVGASVRLIEREVVRAVGIAASAREAALLMRLQSQRDRVESLLRLSRQACPQPSASELTCLEGLLEHFVAAERAGGAVLLRAGAPPIRAGSDPVPLEKAPRAEGQLAAFHRDEAHRGYYLVGAAEAGDSLLVRYQAERFIHALFAEPYGLGESGESFLTDSRGFFLTPSRFGGESGHSHPIEAGPMLKCLSTGDGHSVDADYRGAMVIHGFRRVEEIGGGCIMAHVDYREAMGPARRLAAVIGLVVGSFSLLAAGWSFAYRRVFASPLRRLTRRAKEIEAGDLATEVVEEGPAELRIFAKAFGSMVKSLREVQLAAEKAVGAREEFVSIASHELRTPLTTLRLMYQGALRQVRRAGEEPFDFEKLEKTLRTCDRQVTRLERLISDMLEASRIRAGRLVLQPSPAELGEIVRRSLEQLAGQVEASGCTVELRAEAPAAGLWDEFAIEQVVTNLLTNALKYGQGKPVTIEVSATGGVGRLMVRDRGPGVAPALQAKVFEAFERAVPARHYGGLGLGLFIVKTLVEAHQGTVRLESTPGEGATFLVELPLQDPARREATQNGLGAGDPQAV